MTATQADGWWEIDRYTSTKHPSFSGCPCDHEQGPDGYQFCFAMHGLSRTAVQVRKSINSLLDPAAHDAALHLLHGIQLWAETPVHRQKVLWSPALKRPLAYAAVTAMVLDPEDSYVYPLWPHELDDVLADYPDLLVPLGLRVRRVDLFDGSRAIYHHPWRGAESVEMP